MAGELNYRSGADDREARRMKLPSREVVGKVVTGVAVAAVVMVVLAGVAFWQMTREPFGDATFSVAAWRAADEEGRRRMCRDLMARHLAVGMTEGQVAGLLGKPGDVDRSGRRPPGVFFYSYWVGSWSEGGMDDAFLYVHFDSAGRVMGSEIYGY